MSAAPQATYPPTTAASVKPALSEQAVAFLTQECDRLKDLYTQSEASAQSVFNFYLTFVTTVVGAIVVLLQLGSASGPARTQLTLAILLLFTVVVGCVYLSALSGRYAHMARYARAVDELRRFLIAQLAVPTPPIYEPFLADNAHADTRRDKAVSWLVWVTPTGTYEMFIAIISSAALAAVTWIGLALGHAPVERGVFAALFGFLVALTIFNVYSRLVMRAIDRRFNVRLYVHGEMRLLAGNQ